MTDRAPDDAETRSASVFCAYAREDERFKDELRVHLKMLERQEKITLWHDREIIAGAEWESEIDEKIETADLILLLMSPHFIYSDYCYGKELKVALRQHEARDARVIPIILRPCEWKETDLAKIQALPRDGKPISRWQDPDEAWIDVTQGIRRAIDSLALGNAGHGVSLLPDEPLIDQLRAWEQERPRKACLVLTHLGPIQGNNLGLVGIGIQLRNEGEYPARDVKITKDLGNGFEPEPEGAAIDEILPGKTTRKGIGFSVRGPIKDDTNSWVPGQTQDVRLKVTFRDGLDRRDEAIFTIRMHNQAGLWKPVEDRGEARLSPICQFARPESR